MGEDFVDIQGDIEAGRLITAADAPVPKHITYSLMNRGVRKNGVVKKLRSVKIGTSVFFYADELNHLLSLRRKYTRKK